VDCTPPHVYQPEPVIDRMLGGRVIYLQAGEGLEVFQSLRVDLGYLVHVQIEFCSPHQERENFATVRGKISCKLRKKILQKLKKVFSYPPTF
jgi:hypothetical protein